MQPAGGDVSHNNEKELAEVSHQITDLMKPLPKLSSLKSAERNLSLKVESFEKQLAQRESKVFDGLYKFINEQARNSTRRDSDYLK